MSSSAYDLDRRGPDCGRGGKLTIYSRQRQLRTTPRLNDALKQYYDQSMSDIDDTSLCSGISMQSLSSQYSQISQISQLSGISSINGKRRRPRKFIEPPELFRGESSSTVSSVSSRIRKKNSSLCMKLQESKSLQETMSICSKQSRSTRKSICHMSNAYKSLHEANSTESLQSAIPVKFSCTGAGKDIPKFVYISKPTTCKFTKPATTIQSYARRYIVLRRIQNPASSVAHNSNHRDVSATKIQAIIRGFQLRTHRIFEIKLHLIEKKRSRELKMINLKKMRQMQEAQVRIKILKKKAADVLKEQEDVIIKNEKEIISLRRENMKLKEINHKMRRSIREVKREQKEQEQQNQSQRDDTATTEPAATATVKRSLSSKKSSMKRSSSSKSCRAESSSTDKKQSSTSRRDRHHSERRRSSSSKRLLVTDEKDKIKRESRTSKDKEEKKDSKENIREKLEKRNSSSKVKKSSSSISKEKSPGSLQRDSLHRGKSSSRRKLIKSASTSLVPPTPNNSPVNPDGPMLLKSLPQGSLSLRALHKLEVQNNEEKMEDLTNQLKNDQEEIKKLLQKLDRVNTKSAKEAKRTKKFQRGIEKIQSELESRCTSTKLMSRIMSLTLTLDGVNVETLLAMNVV